MSLKLFFHTKTLCLLVFLAAEVRAQDITAIYQGPDETVSQLLFTSDGSAFGMKNAFRARNSDLHENHSELTVSGDFNGDGLDEIAFFEDVLYDPNMNPEFTCSAVRISRSQGDRFLPAGKCRTKTRLVLAGMVFVGFSSGV